MVARRSFPITGLVNLCRDFCNASIPIRRFHLFHLFIFFIFWNVDCPGRGQDRNLLPMRPVKG